MRGSADLYPAFSSCSIYNPSSSCSLQFTCSSRLNACRIKISLLLLLATSSVDSLRNSNASNLIKPRWMRGPQQPPDCLPCQVPRPQRRVFAHPAVTCIFFCCSAGAKIWPPLFQKKQADWGKRARPRFFRRMYENVTPNNPVGEDVIGRSRDKGSLYEAEKRES